MLLLALLACRPGDVGLLDEGRAPVITGSELVPTVMTVSWSGPPGEVFVEYGLDEALDSSTPVTLSPDGEAEVALMGLKAGRDYSARAVTLSADGERLESEVLRLSTPLPPAHLPRLEASSHAEDLAPGAALTAILQDGPSYLLMLDRDGDVVWWFDVEENVTLTSQALSRDGRRVLALVSDKEQEANIGGIWSVALDGSEAHFQPTEAAHHDFMELPDGRLAWLAVTTQTAEVEGEQVEVIGDELLAAEGIEPPERLFSVFEDYVEPWRACRHFDEGMYGLDGHDWTHANSLIPMGDSEALVGLRNLDALLRVDLETGEPLWQLGGRDSDFTLVGEGIPWAHAHLSHAWEGGLIVFDNGPFELHTVSRVVEYSVDVEARTYSQVWAYESRDHQHVELLGDARKLEGGHVLVSWSTLGLIEEVDVDGKLRWDLRAEIGALFGRVRWIEDLYAPR